MVSGQRSDVSKEWSEEKLLARIKKEIASGKSSKDISSELAEQSGWKKRDVYRLITQKDEEKIP